MDITNNERMRLSASAYRAYIAHAAQMELPLNEDAVDDDILADLIAGLHHYADSRESTSAMPSHPDRPPTTATARARTTLTGSATKSAFASGGTPRCQAAVWWCRSSLSAMVNRPTMSAFPARLTPFPCGDRRSGRLPASPW